jgi:hypothetical protein
MADESRQRGLPLLNARYATDTHSPELPSDLAMFDQRWSGLRSTGMPPIWLCVLSLLSRNACQQHGQFTGANGKLVGAFQIITGRGDPNPVRLILHLFVIPNVTLHFRRTSLEARKMKGRGAC